MGTLPAFCLSQYIRRVTARPSLTWAARRLSSSTSFLIALRRNAGFSCWMMFVSASAAHRFAVSFLPSTITLVPGSMASSAAVISPYSRRYTPSEKSLAHGIAHLLRVTNQIASPSDSR